MEEIPLFPIKIIMIGALGVGKTSLIQKYSKGTIENFEESTSNPRFVSKIKTFNQIKFNIQLWDTAGQEKYKSLTKLFIKDTQIAILVYSIDDEKSFEELDNWLKYILVANDNEKIILGVAANKSDLKSESAISDEKGKEYANKIGAIWKSTSAITEDGEIENFIDELFNNYYLNKFDLDAASSTRSSKLNKAMIRYSTAGSHGNNCCK